MPNKLIDHTLSNIQKASAAARQACSESLTIELLCRTDGLMVRAVLGTPGSNRRWLSDTVSWEAICDEAKNPIVPVMRGVLFRLQRLAEQDGRDGLPPAPATAVLWRKRPNPAKPGHSGITRDLAGRIGDST